MLRYVPGWTAIVLALAFAIQGADRVAAQAPQYHDAQAGGTPPSQPGGQTPSPAGAAVYFVDVKNGDTLQTKTILHFGLKSMGVAPAGVVKPNSGHHHLLIDADLPPLNRPIPNDPQHLHFGGGQTEAEIILPPGHHTLQLLLADKDHIPHSPPVFSDRLMVNVVDSSQPAPVAGREPAPQGARVYFDNLTNGACIQQKFVVKFGLSGMGVAPAGYEKKNTGHHHLVIDFGLAKARPTHSQRRESLALRHRANRGGGLITTRAS